MNLASIYQKYIALDYKKRILIFIFLALILRLLFVHEIDMEMDTYYYACLTQDIRSNIVTGKIFTSPLNHQFYRGIEYRTPLYAFLSAIISLIVGNIEISLILTSLISGCLLVIPVFLLARRLWGDPAGELASLILVFSPHLILYSIMGRTESLYVLMFTCAVYFAVLAYEQGKLKDFILSGAFWGLAYQTRFEALIGAFATAFLFFFRMVDRRTKEKKSESLKKAGSFLLALLILILPYVLIIYKTSGKLDIASPSKKLLDMQESLWIISEKPGGYTSFNYFFGAPGEYDYAKLKTITPKSPDQLFTENAGKIITSIFKAIPGNLKMIFINFNMVLLLFLILPFIGRWKLKDPRIAIVWLYFLVAFPVILLSYWAADPRYFAFFLPLAAVNVGGIIKLLIEGKKLTLAEDEKKNFVFSWILIPVTLLLSWYFYLYDPMMPGWLELNGRDLIITLHKSLVILVFLFIGTGILAVSISVIWKRIFPSLMIPSVGLGLLILIGGFMEAKITHPVKLSSFLNQNFYSPVLSIILWLFMTGLIYEGILYIRRHFKKPLEYQKALVFLSLAALIIVNLQNITTINNGLKVFRYVHYHPEAVKSIKQDGIKPGSVMCAHPRDAFSLGTKWVKIPPFVDFYKFKEVFERDNPHAVIIDSRIMAGISFKPVYPVFLVLKENGELSQVKYYEENNDRIDDETVRVWAYKNKKFEKQNKQTGNDPVKNNKSLPGFNGCFDRTENEVLLYNKPCSSNNKKHSLRFPVRFLSAPKNIQVKTHPWSKFHNDLRNTGRSPYEGVGISAKTVLKFKAGHEIFSSPVISRIGLIIFGCDDSHVYAVDSKGKLRWKYKANYYVSSSPGLGPDGTVYIGSDDQYLYAISPAGRLKWRFKTGYYISSGTAVTNSGKIIFGGEDGFLYCLNQKGKLLWKFKTGGEITGTPAIWKNRVFSTCQDGNLYCVSMKGKLIHKTKIGGELISSPAIGDDGTIYLGSRNHNIYAVSSNGKIKWKFTTGGEILSSPAIAPDGTVLTGSKDGNLYALSSKGKLLWKYETGFSVESSPAVDAVGKIYFGSHDRHIYCLSPKGKLLWKIRTGAAVYSSPAIAPNGTVYAGSMDKYLYGVGK